MTPENLTRLYTIANMVSCGESLSREDIGFLVVQAETAAADRERLQAMVRELREAGQSVENQLVNFAPTDEPAISEIRPVIVAWDEIYARAEALAGSGEGARIRFVGFPTGYRCDCGFECLGDVPANEHIKTTGHSYERQRQEVPSALVLIERYADNGAHSHWDIVARANGRTVGSFPPGGERSSAAEVREYRDMWLGLAQAAERYQTVAHRYKQAEYTCADNCQCVYCQAVRGLLNLLVVPLDSLRRYPGEPQGTPSREEESPGAPLMPAGGEEVGRAH